MPVACIVIGTALVVQGGAVAAEFSNLLTMITEGTRDAIKLGGSKTIELFAGAATIVLGTLGLAGLGSAIPTPVAMINLGSWLIFSAGGVQRPDILRAQAAGVSEIAQQVAWAITAAGIYVEVLIGAAAIVLGILALIVSVHTAILTLVGLLMLGPIAISSTALIGRMARMFNIQGAS